jgi:peptidoglycan/LPS O-acetylase OafA/YrhL
VAGARPSYRPDVEGLRALAVVLVVLNHLLAVPAGGFIGVDLFFVISGFVITAMLWRETSERHFTFRGFYARRVRRLLPSALLVLLVTNLAAQYFFFGPRVQQTRTDTGWALAFLANVHMARTDTDYFHANDAPSLLQHFWSLAVEEQFYFVWPLVLVLLALFARRELGRRLMLPVTLLLTAVSFGYAVQLVAKDPVQAYFSAPARAWELGVGAILGLLVSWGLRLPRRLQHFFSWLGIGLVVAACAFIDPNQPFPGAAALVPVAAGVSLILAGSGKAVPRATRLLRRPVARYIGRISYPVYLWHWPVIVVSEEVWGRNVLVWVAAPFASVMLAVLTHHLLEDPLRGRVGVRQAYRELLPGLRGKGFVKWVPVKNFAIGSMAYGLVLTSIALVAVPKVAAPLNAAVVDSAVASSPLPKNVSPEQAKLTAEIEASLRLTKWPAKLEPSLDQLPDSAAPEWIHDNCLDVNNSNLARCRYGPSNAIHHAVIMGDSIAMSYLPGLRLALEPLGWDFQMLTQHVCNNAVSVMDGGSPYLSCDRHRQWAIDQVREIRPDLVLLANVTNVDNIVASKIVNSRIDTWKSGLTHTIEQLSGSAQRVIVVSPPPGTKNLQRCLTRSSTPSECASSVSPAWDAMQTAESQAASSTDAEYINTSNWFCEYGFCPALIGRTPVYFDGGHLTAAYSRHLTGVWAKTLKPLLASVRTS